MMQGVEVKLTETQKTLVKPIKRFLTLDTQGRKKTLSKISWYINNNGFIATTTDGYLIKYDQDGKAVTEIRAHEG